MGYNEGGGRVGVWHITSKKPNKVTSLYPKGFNRIQVFEMSEPNLIDSGIE